MDMIPEGYYRIAPWTNPVSACLHQPREVNIKCGHAVGRINPGDKAIMVLNVDSEVPDSVMEEIRGMPGIFTATFAKISSEKI